MLASAFASVECCCYATTFYAASSLGWHTVGPLTPTNSATVAMRRCVAPGSSKSGANKGGTSSHTTSIADDIG
jgi:hypothetical protein